MADSDHSQKLHFILFPFMAQGRMIPMFDIARLLAQHGGVLITIITTPINANRFRQILDRDVESGLPINLVELKFPAKEAGLPQDCENLDMLNSLSLAFDFYSALNLLQEPVERLLLEMNPRPNCIISDVNFPYTSRVATKLHLPRISFTGFSCFCVLCIDRVYNSRMLEQESINSEMEYFSVPGLPHHIEMTKQQLPRAMIPNFGPIGDQIKAAEEVTYGIIMNSFEELEPEYVQECKKISDQKVWCIGPVSLINNNMDLIQRGDKISIEKSEEYFKWLDKKQSGSVIYVCFGSMCNLVTLQLVELALGLEVSNRSFVWVLRGGGKSIELEKWIEEEGFEERTKGRSLIIRGWAPQLAILSHVAIGGFLTHCGWNSTLEGISSGIPLITWPLFADQFCNEKLVVDVLKIGVKVGAEATIVWGEEDKIGVLVKKEDVTKAISKLMDDGEEGEERRRRAKELSLKAKKAVGGNGSSYLNLKQLIQDIQTLNLVRT